MLDVKRYPRESLRDEKGMVLVVALLLISALVLLGTTAVMTSTTDMKISTNNKTGNQAFYVAEAGTEEARARLKNFNPANSIAIVDAHNTQTGWAAYIGPEIKAQGKGYNSGNAMHVRVTSLQSALDYTVKIEHQINAANQVLYWGDANGDGLSERNATTGENIYLVTSYGVAANANKTIAVEMTRLPPITVPAALYVKATTTIQGTSTHILGTDQCGGASKPGIVTTLATSTVGTSGNPVITGSTSPTGTPPSVVGNSTNNMNVPAMIDSLKGGADYTYNVASATHTGMAWGTPTPGATQDNPSSCSEKHIVYYNTSNGTNLTDITLSGGTTGCGILLVDGDLDASGGFSWYGIILVSGSVRITGGGDKNITGGMVAGGSADADLVGGNVSIVYCSSAVNDQTANQPLLKLSWKEGT